MLKQAIGTICRTNVYAYEGNKVLPWRYVPSCCFHSGQVKSPILSFKAFFFPVNYLLLLEFLIYMFTGLLHLTATYGSVVK